MNWADAAALGSDDDLDPGYLLALLPSPTVQEWIEARSGAASAIPSISAKSLGVMPVKLPPPDDQRRIGLGIDALDTQITTHAPWPRPPRLHGPLWPTTLSTSCWRPAIP